MLWVTVDSYEASHQDAHDCRNREEAGEEVPHIVKLQSLSDLRALITVRRIELLQNLMIEQPDGIRQLAKRLNRNIKSVYNDLEILAEYDIVHFEQVGQAKQPFVPYDTVKFSLKISASNAADDEG